MDVRKCSIVVSFVMSIMNGISMWNNRYYQINHINHDIGFRYIQRLLVSHTDTIILPNNIWNFYQQTYIDEYYMVDGVWVEGSIQCLCCKEYNLWVEQIHTKSSFLFSYLLEGGDNTSRKSDKRQEHVAFDSASHSFGK